MFFFFKQKTAYEMRISDWSSDVCSSDLQSLEALTIGDAGQRILFGETLQRVFQHATLAHMAQATAQSSPIEHITYQPIADAIRRVRRFMLEQQDSQIGRASCRERVCQTV